MCLAIMLVHGGYEEQDNEGTYKGMQCMPVALHGVFMVQWEPQAPTSTCGTSKHTEPDRGQGTRRRGQGVT